MPVIIYAKGKEPIKSGRPATPAAERFWPKVSVRSEDECWEWAGGKTSLGYGCFYWSPGKCENAQRSSWKIHYGDIPLGKSVLHKCDNKGCVNPNHLYLGTASDNMTDRVRRSPETFVAPRGSRLFEDDEIQRIRELYSTGDTHRDFWLLYMDAAMLQ